MSDAISAAPIVSALAPLVISATGAVISGAVLYGAALWRRWTHQELSQNALNRVTAWASTEAGALVAAAADNLATGQFHVGSPVVAAIVTKITSALPAELAAAGLTSDHVATLVAGEIGRLQAQMTFSEPVSVVRAK